MRLNPSWQTFQYVELACLNPHTELLQFRLKLEDTFLLFIKSPDFDVVDSTSISCAYHAVWFWARVAHVLKHSA